MTNTQENGGRNWFAVIAFFLIVAFILLIVGPCACVVHLYETGKLVAAGIILLFTLVVTFFWILGLINFIDYVHKNNQND